MHTAYEAGSNPHHGIVGIHKLFFKSGSIKPTDLTDARNYYTIYKK